MRNRWIGGALALMLAVGLGIGIAALGEPGEARADGSERVVKIAGEAAYVMFVDRLDPPNTTYHLRGNLAVVVYEDWVQVAFAEGKQYVIPRERVIYMGTEEIQ